MAVRLDPLGAQSFAHLLGRALRANRQYEDAVAAYKEMRAPRFLHHAELATCYAEVGRKNEVEFHKAETLRLNPEFSIRKYVSGLSYRKAADREHLRDSPAMAGLPH